MRDYEAGAGRDEATYLAGSVTRTVAFGVAIIGRVRAVLATGGVAKYLAGLGTSRCLELGDLSPKGGTRNRVDVVEVDDAVRRNSVVRCQRELRHKIADRPGDGCDHNRPDSISHGVAGENQHGAVAAWCFCEPDFTLLHRPNPTSLRRVPTRRFGRWLTRPW